MPILSFLATFLKFFNFFSSKNLLHAAVIGGRLSALTYLIKWLLERDRIKSEDNDEKRSLKSVKKVARKDKIGEDEKKKYSDMNDKYDDTYDAFVCNDQNSDTESLLHQFLCGVDDHGRTPTDLAKEGKQVSISCIVCIIKLLFNSYISILLSMSTYMEQRTLYLL